MVQDMHRQSKVELNASSMGILPSIQVKEYYLDEEFPLVRFEKCVESALEAPSAGVVFWSWDALEQDAQRMKVVRDCLNKAL